MSLDSWGHILMVCAGLGSVIFVHELGHFLVAKACGVKCEKFYVGFDMFDVKIGDFVIIPRALFKWQWGETEYGIGIVPLGGYVKMLGQDDNPTNAAEERRRSMLNASEANEDESAIAKGSIAKGSMAEGSMAAQANNSGAANQTVTPDDVDEEQNFELDPRSYQAKSVPQRMAIISAGVIMNLIFAVVFATSAIKMGVLDPAAQVGYLLPGSAAWENNIGYGSTIESINGVKPKRGFRGIAQASALNGSKEAMTLELHDELNDTQSTVELTPRLTNFGKAINLPSFGFGSSLSLVFNSESPSAIGQAGAKAEPAFEGGDKIVGVQVGDAAAIDTANIYQLKKVLAQHASEELKLIVERSGEGKDAAAESVDIQVPANPMKGIGLVMKPSAIEGIQKGSPAEQAGFRKGDVLLSMENEPIGNVFTLPARLTTMAKEEQSVSIVVERTSKDGQKEQVTLSVTPQLAISSPLYMSDRPIAIDELGICFKVSTTVDSVASGSSAEAAGVQAGDKILKLQFQASNPADAAAEKKLGLTHEEINLTGLDHAWPEIQLVMNSHLEGTKVLLTVKREDKVLPAFETELAESTEFFQRTRGLYLTPLQEKYIAQSMSEAVSLGFEQTVEDCLSVYRFLQKLISQELSALNLGGPGSIAVAATSQAGEGLPNLLMFLTLISANLAVVNFLPIPVLDGGHMVFLMYEAVFRKPIGEKMMVAMSLAGLGFILCLMLFVISLDVWRNLF